MAGTDMKFVVTATDHASAVLAGVGKSVDSLDAKTKRLRAAAGMMSAGAIIAFGASSVKAYAEAEAQQVKLQEAYRKFPAIASVSIDSMRQLNSAIQAKTGSDDDELAAAEAKLAMYNLTGQQIQQLIPLVNDYAIATGTSTVDAAQTLGKAMMGNARALKALGIDFKATGDRTKDFQAIYDALQGKVGGAGEAFGRTTAGQVKILQQSFSDLQEEVGAQLVPALKTLVDVAKPLLGAFGNLPQPVKSVTVLLGAAAAASLLLGPRIVALGTALSGLLPAGAAAATGLEAESAAATGAAASSGRAATSVGLLGRALGPIGIGITATVAAMQAWQLALDKMGAGADGVNALADGVKAQNAEAAEAALNSYKASQATGSWQSALGLLVSTGGLGMPAIVQGFRNAGDATANLDKQLAQMVGQGNAASAASMIAALGMSADEARAKFPEYAQALDEAGRAAGGAVGQFDELASSTANGVDKAKLATDTMNGLKAALDALGGKAISVNDATSGLEESYDKAATTAKELTQKQGELGAAVTRGGASLDLSTEAGRKAHDALKDIATSADSAAVAYSAAGMSSDEIAKKTTEARAEFIKSARQMGLSASAAESLADSYGLIPRQVKTTITNNAASAVRQAVINYIAALNSIPEERRTQIITEYITEGSKPKRPVMGSDTVTQADGGYISGAGTSTSDSIPAMLSNGEYVIRASSVQRLGLGLLNDLNDDGHSTRLRFAKGGVAAITVDTHTGKALNADQIKARNDLAVNYTNRTSSFADIQSAWDVKAYPEKQAALREAIAAVTDALDAQKEAATKVSDAMRTQQEATDGVSSATAALADAKRRVMLARTPEDRAAALKEQASAEQNLARSRVEQAKATDAVTRARQDEAQATKDVTAARKNQERAEAAVKAAKPTVGNIVGALRAKVAKVKTFSINLKRLAQMGIPPAILKDLVDAGPDEGGQIADALLRAKPPDIAELVQLQKDLDVYSGRVGMAGANGELGFREYTPGKGARTRGLADQPGEPIQVTTVVNLDGRQIATALAQYKKSIGGRPLGLA